jgi:hypothetical protein
MWMKKALRTWGLATLLMFAIMLTHQSDSPRLLGRYSVLVGGMLVALIMLAGGSLWLASKSQWLQKAEIRLQQWRARPYFAPLLIIGGAVVIFAVYYGFLADPIPTYGLLRAFIAFSILFWALAVLCAGQADSNSTASPVLWAGLGLLALAVCLALFAIGSGYYPPLLKTDESWTYSMAINMIETGRTGPAINAGIVGDYYAWAGLWTQALTTWTRLLGAGLLQGRAFMVLAGLAGVLFTGLATARLYGRNAGWLAAMVGFFAVIRLGYLRPDMVVALYLSVALYAHAYAVTRPWPLGHLVAGFFAGLCIDAAPIAYAFGLGLALYYLANPQWRFRGPFWRLVLGGLLALGVYWLTRAGAVWYGEVNQSASYLRDIVTGWQNGRFLSQAGNVVQTLGTGLAPLTGLALWGAWALLRQAGVAKLPLFMGVGWGLIILFAGYYFPPFYAAQGLPILLMLAGYGLALGWQGLLHSSQNGRFALAVGLMLMAWLTAWTLKTSSASETLADVVAVGGELADLLPADALIVGAEPFYFGLLASHPLQFRTGAYEQSSQALIGRSPEATWDFLRPDVIIFSAYWPQEPKRTPALESYMQGRDFRLRWCWQTQSFGQVTVWVRGSLTPLGLGNPCPSS